MGVNSLSFQQCSTILTSLVKQATGRDVVVSTTPDFISVAQTALSLPKDIIYNTLSDVLARTIFSIRPYDARFAGLEKDLPTWGGYMRKLAIAEDDWSDSKAYAWPVAYDSSQSGHETGDGYSVDQYVINKRKVQQTNFIGQSVFQDHYTIFDEQLETAFRGPEELSSFLSMLTTYMSNKIELAKDGLSTGLISNLIGTLIAEAGGNASPRVVKLLTEYNAVTGMASTEGAYTASTIFLPDNYPSFMKWCYGRIAAVANKFRAMSVKYQTTVNSQPIARHTPYDKQKLYILDDERYQMESRVLADTFHDNYLSLADVESVPFWQGIDTPDKVIVKPTYTNTSGVVTTAGSAITQTGVFALLFDTDAAGWAMVHQNMLPARNAAGEYTNMWANMRLRCFQDNTEKAVVFLLA